MEKVREGQKKNPKTTPRRKKNFEEAIGRELRLGGAPNSWCGRGKIGGKKKGDSRGKGEKKGRRRTRSRGTFGT